MSTFMEQWALLLAPNRKTSAGVKLDPLVEGRNPFLADYDRIIFSARFAGWQEKRRCTLWCATIISTTALPIRLR